MRRFLFSMFLLSPLAQADIDPDWSFYGGLLGPGMNGMVLHDLDGDGKAEAVVTGRSFGPYGDGPNMYLAVMAHGPDGYQNASMLPLARTSFVGTIQAIPARGGIDNSILVGQSTTDGIVLVRYTGVPLREISRVNVPGYFHLMQVADVDADGDLEVLGSIGSFLGSPAILDLQSGAIEWSSPGETRGIAAGQLDADPQLEVVLGLNSGPGRVIDGATHAEEWAYPDGFAGMPVFGNFHGAPGSSREFGVVSPWGVTRIFVTQPIYSPVSEIPTGEVGAYTVADINSDGNDELIIGEGQWGDIVGYTPALGTERFRYHNPEHGVSAVVVGDMDGNGSMELVHGAGLSSSGEDIFRVLNADTGDVLYALTDEVGPHSSMMLADLDGNQNPELIWATTETRSGYSGATLVVLDAESGIELRRRENVLEPWGSNPGVSMLPVDINGDGSPEIAVASGRLYTPVVAVLDASTLEDIWRIQIEDAGDSVTAMQKIRFNSDNVEDLVVVSGQRLLVLDGRDGQELFRSVSFSMGTISALAVGEVDNDGTQEIVFSVNTTLYVIDAATQLVQQNHPIEAGPMGLAVETGTTPCRIVLTYPTRLEQRSCADGTLQSTRPFGLTAEYVGVPQDSDGPLILSDGFRVHRLQQDTISARSIGLDFSLGDVNRGVAVGGPGEIEIYVGGMLGVHRITLPMEEPMFESGFEANE